MNFTLIIGISISAAVIATVGIKIVLHNILQFKMDESVILKILKETNDGERVVSTKKIAATTDFTTARVSEVCTKSKLIKRNTDAEESWCYRK